MDQRTGPVYPSFGSDKSLVSEGFEGQLNILTVRVIGDPQESPNADIAKQDAVDHYTSN